VGGHGVDGFTAEIVRVGGNPVVEHSLVTFTVTPASGAHAGAEVRSGVALAELHGWPIVPPHWVHLPAEITIGRTNATPSTMPGWLAHSRETSAGWGATGRHAIEWLAHVRGVLAEAAA
jgi:hypothetical protein